MGLYNFQSRFVPHILNGSKKHTIRAKRKHRAKVGETLHLYTGLRTKKAKLLKRVTCVAVQDVRIELRLHEGSGVLARGCRFPTIFIEGIRLSRSEAQQLARCDGFDTFAEMISFWEGRLPFNGDFIHWKD